MWLGNSSYTQRHAASEFGEVAGFKRIALTIAFTVTNPNRGVASAGPSDTRRAACAAGSTGAAGDAPSVSK